MAGKYPGLWLKGGTFYVRKVVPAALRAKVGKSELIESLQTGDRRDAERFYPEVMKRFNARIIEAKTSGPIQGPLDNGGAHSREFRLPMLEWSMSYVRAPMADDEPTSTDWRLTQEIENLRVASETGDFSAIPDFDATFVSMMRAGGSTAPIDDAFIAEFRRDAAALRAGALQVRERQRLAAAHRSRLEAVQALPIKSVGVASAKPEKPLPAPSLSLRKLFDQWLLTKRVDDKEKGRLEHQIKRLIEVVGDKPANHLTKAEVREFMALVARFPGRKRTAELNALPMKALVEKFEANNAKIAKRNAAKKPGEPLEEIPGTLKAATVDEWFSAYRQMFDYAVAMLDFEYNPFEATKKFVVRGAEATKKREFTPEEVTAIFSKPMFQGFEGDGLRGYRNKPGTTIVRDAKYWLPILALFHGGRLTEFAAMPVDDLKQTPGGSWYFDLTDRKVKNATSKRTLPLHPHMIELGFLTYVETVRKTNSPWLFPDLDHETKHGPGHAFSKWWGNWMDAHGLTDPTITHHSWRHTWKRAARQSEVKEEMHDVISGHKGQAVSRSYGEGADVDALAVEMAKITFPAFPAIPVAIR